MHTTTMSLTPQLRATNFLKLFRSEKAAPIAINGREVATLQAVKMSADGICAADVLTVIGSATGSSPRLATVYNTILDLEKKGLIKASGTASSQHGGRPRRLYSLTPTGEMALELAGKLADAVSAEPILA